MDKPSSFTVSLNFPFFGVGIEGTWEPDESERKAAWEMYIELVTRISVAELNPDEGLLREALSSLYSLFDTTRSILRTYGPTVAQAKGEGTLSFGYLAVAILNRVLRPILVKWHPLLLDYESTKTSSISATIHERQWEKNEELRQVLNDARQVLTEYAELLAEVAGVPSLVAQTS